MVYLLSSRKTEYIFYNRNKEDIYICPKHNNDVRLKYPPGYIFALVLIVPMIFISIILGSNYVAWIACDVAYLLLVLISILADTKRRKRIIKTGKAVAIKELYTLHSDELLHKINEGSKNVYPYCARANGLYVWLVFTLIGRVFTDNYLIDYLLVLSIEAICFSCLPLRLNKLAIKRITSILSVS